MFLKFGDLIRLAEKFLIVVNYIQTLCPLFYIFLPNDNSSKIMENFLFNLSSSFCSLDIYMLVIFPFLYALSRFKRTNESGIIFDVMNWLAQLRRCNFWNHSKTTWYCIINFCQVIKKLFWTCFVTWWLVLGPFFFS